MQIFILSANNKPLCSLSNNNDSLNTFNFYDSKFTCYLKTPNTFEFSCPMNHENSKYIKVGNQVIFKYKDNYHLFKITEMEESHGDLHTANCYCEGASLDLLNSVVMPINLPTATLGTILPTILSGTEWKVGALPEDTLSKPFEITDYPTVLEVLQELAELFELDVQYRIDYNSSRGITGKFIDFQKTLGKRTGIRFEYGVNATDVTKKVNSENVCTAVIPIGNEDLNISTATCTVAQQGFDKPSGQTFVALPDEERSKVTNSPYHLFTTIEVETDDPYLLAQKGWEHLQENKVPKIEYTFNPAKLTDEIDIGDKVYCIDRDMGLQLEATVSELSRCFEDPLDDEVTLTNFVDAISSINKDLIKQIQNQLKDLEIDSNVIFAPTQPEVETDKPIIWVPIQGEIGSGDETIIGDINIWTGDEWVDTTDKIESDLKNWVLEQGEMKILMQPIEPVDVQDKQIWIDTSTEPYEWKRWDADKGEWVKVNFTSADEMNDVYSITEVDQMVDEVNGVISSKVSRDTYELDLDAMKSRLSEAESEIRQTVDEISFRVEETAPRDIEAEMNATGANLLAWTKFSRFADKWELYREGYCTLDFEQGWAKLTSTEVSGIMSIATKLGEYGIGSVTTGETYTLSFDGYASEETPMKHFYLLSVDGEMEIADEITLTTVSNRHAITFTATQTLNNIGIRLGLSATENNKKEKCIYLHGIKLERGSYNSEWTPCPTDNFNLIDQAMAQIKLNKDNIDLKVGQGDIISAINLSPEAIKISSDKVDIAGTVTFSMLDDELKAEVQKIDTAITDALNASSTANNAVSTANQASNIINEWSHINDKTMIDGGKIYTNSLSANSIYGGTLSGVDIYVNSDAYIGDDLHLGTGSSSSTSRSVRFNGTDTWIYTSGDGLVIDSLGTLQLNPTSIRIGNTGYSTVTNVYGTLNLGNATVNGLNISGYVKDTYLTVTSDTLYAPSIIRASGVQAFYFSGSMVVLSTNNYMTQICGSSIYSSKAISVSSDANKKENIVNVNDDDFADFALGIDLVEYNYIDDPTKEKYVGAIAQQVRDIDPNISKYYVDVNENDGTLGIKESALVYPIISTLKRQQKQIEEQEERIAKLEAMVEALMNK